MNGKKIAIGVLVATILQIMLIMWLSTNKLYREAGMGWTEIILSSWPLIPTAIFTGYIVSMYKKLTGWMSKNRVLAAILISIFLYILSIFIYANAIFITR